VSRKAASYTVADIAQNKSMSDSKVRRALSGIEPADHVAGYNGRKIAAYSKEQIATAFPKTKKPPKA
jgi:hypothetical protein